MRGSECRAAKHHPNAPLNAGDDLARTLAWTKVDDPNLVTTDLTDLLESVDDGWELDPPTQDIEDFLVDERNLSPDESQKRPVYRRSWIAMPASNMNAGGSVKVEEPTTTYRPPVRASLPKFPLLPAPPRPAAAALPSFPLLPAEPQRPKTKVPPVRLPRFAIHDGEPMASRLPARPRGGVIRDFPSLGRI